MNSPEESGCGADVSALINVRNDYRDGRGPAVEAVIVTTSSELQEKLQRCMEALSLFTQYPMRLVQDFESHPIASAERVGELFAQWAQQRR